MVEPMMVALVVVRLLLMQRTLEPESHLESVLQAGKRALKAVPVLLVAPTYPVPMVATRELVLQMRTRLEVLQGQESEGLAPTPALQAVLLGWWSRLWWR